VNGDDSLDGGDGNDILHGQAGNDILQGRAGNDVMIGGIGDDVYFVDSREDVVVESDGGGVDTVRSTAQLFYLPGFVENGIAIGTGRVDIVGNALDNRLVGTDVTNILEGGDGDDTLYGNGGMDRLEGGLGNDVLYGGTGFDQMYGGAGDDILIGGPGANQYRGDSGIDFLIFLTADGLDDPSFIIFNSQEDWLDLSRIDADLTQDGDQAFHLVSALTGQPGELWIDPTLQDWVDEFGDVVMENYYQNIYGDVDGDGVPDLFIRSELPETFPVLPDAIIL
jgi:Ca2+-binding RTX toxin-like protein